MGFCLMQTSMAPIASQAERPGLNPELFGAQRAPHGGSSAMVTKAWSARSKRVGMPQGRFSSVAGWGLPTRRTGGVLWFTLSVLTKATRWSGVKDFLPSTPAVFFPWFSCVPRRAAQRLADHDCINRLWSERTSLPSPRHWARSMRFWSFNTPRSTFFHEIVFHPSIGCRTTVCRASGLLRVPLPSRLACSRQHILWLSQRRWLFEHSLRCPVSG